MTAREWVELIAVSTIPLSLVILFINRWLKNFGLGVRASQFVAVCSFPPLIIVLAMEKVLDGSTVAALVGGFIGYLFSNISEFDRRKAEKDGKKEVAATK